LPSWSPPSSPSPSLSASASPPSSLSWMTRLRLLRRAPEGTLGESESRFVFPRPLPLPLPLPLPFASRLLQPHPEPRQMRTRTKSQGHRHKDPQAWNACEITGAADGSQSERKQVALCAPLTPAPSMHPAPPQAFGEPTYGRSLCFSWSCLAASSARASSALNSARSNMFSFSLPHHRTHET
jgi:hypothetical protein